MTRKDKPTMRKPTKLPSMTMMMTTMRIRRGRKSHNVPLGNHANLSDFQNRREPHNDTYISRQSTHITETTQGS